MTEELYRATVRIEPDFTGFDEEARARIEAATAGRHEVNIDVDAGAAITELGALGAAAGGAQATLGGLETVAQDAAGAFGGAGGAGGSVASAFGAAASGATKFAAAVAPLALGLSALSVGSLGAEGLVTGVIGLASAFTSASAGIVGFGAVVATEASQASDATKKLAAAQAAVDNATTARGREAALARQKQLLDSLDPTIVTLGRDLGSLNDEWKAFADAFRPEVVQLVDTAVTSLGQILPELEPVVASGAVALNIAAKSFAAALESPTGREFFAFLADEAGPTLLRFTDTFLHLGSGVIGLFEAFAPLTDQLVAGIDHAAGSFDHWAHSLQGSEAFKGFVSFMSDNGPLLVHTLEDIGRLGVQVVLDFAPLAPALLMFADEVAQLGTQVLQTLQPALAWFGGWLSSNPALIEGVARTLVLLVGGVTLVGDNFRQLEHQVGEAVSFIANVVADFVDGMLGGFGEIVHGADFAFGWIPGIGDGLDTASRKFDNFRDTAVSDLRQIGAAALALGTIAGTPGQSFTSGGPGGHLLGDLPQQKPVAGTEFSLPSFDDLLAQFDKLMAGWRAGAPDTSTPPGPLPFIGGGGAKGPTVAQTMEALAALQGLDIGRSLLRGIQTGVSPLDVLMKQLNKDIGEKAQPIADQFRSIFDTALSYGEKAQQSLIPNVVSGLPELGSSKTITFENGRLVTRENSPILGGLGVTLRNDQRFVGDIGKARALGLSDTIIGQFVQAGPSSLAQLDKLANSSPGEVAQINSTFGALSALGTQFGVQEAQVQYLQQIHSTLLQVLTALVQQLPPEIGRAVGAAINAAASGGAKRAAASISLGPFGR